VLTNLTSPRWWFSRLTELFVASALAYLTVNMIVYREALQKADIPATDWFVLQEIYVPDHVEGSNPGMIYDRLILESHRGFWVAEVQKVNPGGREGVFQNYCSGSGVDDYDIVDVLGPDGTVNWNWFFGRPCAVGPGTYRIQLTRDMTKPDFPVKQMRGWSNTFRVLPAS